MTTSSTTTGSPTPTARSGNPALDAVFPPTITATPVGHNYVRLPVPTADLSAEVNIHGGLLAALVDHGAFAGEVYPALSTNDGASWTVAGPQLASAGSCGACATSRLTVGRHDALLAWGPGGSFVKTTSDLGQHWFSAHFLHGVVDVQARGRQIIVRAGGAETPSGRFPTRQYASTDGGHHWQRGRALADVRRLR